MNNQETTYLFSNQWILREMLTAILQHNPRELPEVGREIGLKYQTLLNFYRGKPTRLVSFLKIINWIENLMGREWLREQMSKLIASSQDVVVSEPSDVQTRIDDE